MAYLGGRALGDAAPTKTAPKCHLKRRLKGSCRSTLIVFFPYQKFVIPNVFLTKMYSCIRAFFACDAVNLKASCSLLVLCRKLYCY